MRAILVFTCIAIAVVFATVSVSRGEGEATDSPTTPADDTTEPITGTAIMPMKGSETPPRDPFTPYDIGGAEAAWKYEDLTADEKAAAAQGLNEDQSKVQDAYAASAKAIVAQAKADAAAIQLGADPALDQMGVVP